MLRCKDIAYNKPTIHCNSYNGECVVVYTADRTRPKYSDDKVLFFKNKKEAEYFIEHTSTCELYKYY